MIRPAARRFASVALALTVLSLGLYASVAAAAPVGFPNPRNGGYIKLDGGSRPFQWTDPAVAEGGNPAGTTYRLYLQDEELATGFVEQGPGWTKSTDGAETFTWNNAGILSRRKVYQWRVDASDGVTTTTGTTWTVNVPMNEPVDGSQDVSVYVRFVWDPPVAHLYEDPVAPSGTPVVEKMLLIDQDETATGYVKNWVSVNQQTGALSIIDSHVAKTYDPGAAAGSRARVREFWTLDTGYPGFSGITRLLPGRNYRWRVLYCNKDGGPLYIERNGTNGQQSPAEEYYWADGGGDFATGWSFRTVGVVSGLDQDDDTIESVIIYWQSPYGTLARDPAENYHTFADEAARLALIHSQNHAPAVGTAIVGSEAVTASYGGHNNNAGKTAQAPWVPEITQFPGWYTMTRAQKHASPSNFTADDLNYAASIQDRYHEYTARAIRTYLQDTANRTAFGATNERSDLRNLQYVVLLGDGARIPASFYYYGSTHTRWVPTDFFYSTQDANSEVKTAPRFQVSRIPLRQITYPTTDQNGSSYHPEDAFLTKTRNYVNLLNSASKKTAAFTQWFGRAAIVAGSTEYYRWYQSFSAFTQHLLGQRVPVGGGTLRDAFSGIKVRKYDVFGGANPEESLLSTNVLRHLSNPTSPNDVPGFVYLLTRRDWWFTGSPGSAVNLWPFDPTFNPTRGIRAANFATAYPDDLAGGRRPLLVGASSQINRYDNALWSSAYGPSIGEAASLAGGGPIGVVGFSSDYYNGNISFAKSYPDGSSEDVVWNLGTDEYEGFSYATIDKGVVKMSENGNENTPIKGKLDFVRLFARQYAQTTQPGIGNVFNKALTEYITSNAELFTNNDERVVTTIFGATILGDSALVMPAVQRSVQDNTRPTLTDSNPRAGTEVAGYTATPVYNSDDMPIHVIPNQAVYDPNFGTTVTINIQTNAPFVRVRTATPFLMNSGYTPGGWINTTEVAANSTEVYATTGGSYNYSFTAKTPSIYFVVVQAQNPAWQGGDPVEWRWLQERWIYVHIVNQFVRDSNVNVLVIDDDTHDRYYLNGQDVSNVDHNNLATRTFYDHMETYYVNPGRDGEGYAVGTQDPPTFLNKFNEPITPVLPALNQALGEDIGISGRYRYQYWCSNVYTTHAINGSDIKTGQRYYGEITPAALKSFQDSKGVVMTFAGDDGRPAPRGYLFDYNSMPYSTVRFFSEFLNNGGKLFISNQEMANEGVYLANFMRDYLGATTETADTDYTNMDGLQIGTLSEFIQDVNIVGGDGMFNAVTTAELTLNGVEARTLFTWDPTSGPGTTNGDRTSAVSNRLLASGARTVFFAWPFEAIDKAGSVDPLDPQAGDLSGRLNVMRQVVDWLRSVPKAAAPDPAHESVGVSLSKQLSWSRVPEASHYRLHISTDLATLGTGNGTIIDRDNPRYTPPTTLLQDTRYFWRVDTRNVDDYTIGDVWSFNTVAPASKAANPDPADGATQVPLDKVLSWTPDPLVEEYDITIWKDGVLFDSATNLTSASFTPRADAVPPGLDPNPTGDIVYTWRVDTRNELGTTNGDVWQFQTITPPPAPTNPDPAHNGSNVVSNKTLTWNATLRTDEYHVFVWRADSGVVAPADDADPATFSKWSGVTTTNSFVPGELDTPDIAYRWQVRPVNRAGRNNATSIWNFTTALVVSDPLQPTNPRPANGSAGAPVNVTLEWDRAPGASSYDVFFWEATEVEPTSPIVTGITTTSLFVPNFVEPLEIGKSYRWRVNARNSLNVVTVGSLWEFLVGPEKTSGHFPAAGATGVPVNVTLDWDDAAGAASYRVFFAAKKVPTTPTATVTVSEFQPPTALLPVTMYQWRVDSVAEDGTTITVGDVLTFTTTTASGLPNAVTGMSPGNNATDVAIDVILKWKAAAGASSYDLYFAENALPGTPTATGLTATQFDPPGNLTANTTYRWRVDAVNDLGVTTGPAFAFTTGTSTGGGSGGAGGGGGGGGGSCFIATSAYESALPGIGEIAEANCTGLYQITPERHEQLNHIRSLRDTFLMNLSAGREFSAWYYAVGPYAATAIRNHEPVKAAVRAVVLNPLAEISRACAESETEK